MKNTYLKYLLSASLLGAIAMPTLQARSINYNVACIKGRVSNLEKTLKDNFQFRKPLLDAANKGQQYHCFFRINDNDIKCVNPNYVRSGGDKELERDGYALDNAISGGNLGKSKAGTVCYFKKDAVAKYKDLRSRLAEKNQLEDFIGARESANALSSSASSITKAKEILDQEIEGENSEPEIKEVIEEEISVQPIPAATSAPTTKEQFDL
jgi:hypothetical protein